MAGRRSRHSTQPRTKYCEVFHAYTLSCALVIVDPSSCNNLPVARAFSSEPSRIAGPFYRSSARHLFSVIGHITASAFERLRISALLVQILALFPRADMGQIVEPTGTYRSYSSSEVCIAEPGMTFG